MAFLHNGKLGHDDALYQANKNEAPSEIASLEKNRFHLYVSNTCPFSQRAIAITKLLELHEYISISEVSPKKDKHSWEFDENYIDPINNNQYLYQVYQSAKVDYSGRITVPVLWDKKLNTIASTDSLAIAIWLSEQGKTIGKLDLIPENITSSIKKQCDGIHKNINLSFVQNLKLNFVSSTLHQFFNNLELLNTNFKNDSFYYNDENITLTDIILLPTLIQLENAYTTQYKHKLTKYRDFDYLNKYYLKLTSQKAIKKAFNLN
jgi:putative glutathione S-transferase